MLFSKNFNIAYFTEDASRDKKNSDKGSHHASIEPKLEEN